MLDGFSLLSSSAIAITGAAAVLVPAVTVALLSPWSLREGTQRIEGHEEVSSRLAVVGAVGVLVHALQVERGLSVAALNGGPRDRLPAVRETSDGSWLLLWQACESCGSWPEAVALQKQCALGLEADLAALRRSIDAKDCSAQQGLQRYCERIAVLIAFVERLVTLTLRGTEGRLGQAYVTLITAKEAAGQERATGNAALSAEAARGHAVGNGAFFGRNRGPSPLHLAHRRIADLGEDQHVYLSLLRQAAPQAVSEQVKRWEQTQKRFLELRRRVLDGDASVSPSQWFSAATERIDGLKAIEDALCAEMSAAGEASYHHARGVRRTLRMVAGGALSSLFAGLYGVLHVLG